MQLKIKEWDKSYLNKQNYVFYPHEEVIRFFAKHIVKKRGFNEFEYLNNSKNKKILDLGCGIGRHVIFSHEMGLDAYGIDISSVAIKFAKIWAKKNNIKNIGSKIVESQIQQIPFKDSYFNFIISHGVLDSMAFELALSAADETYRILKKNGLFYCDLISNKNSLIKKNFSGEIVVKNRHEKNTIQSFFNKKKILRLFKKFKIIEISHITKKDIFTNTFHSRYHVVVQK